MPLWINVPGQYYVFDLLAFDDRVPIDLPYSRRRELLEALPLIAPGVIQLSPTFLDDRPT